jgi:hypothetical protein
VEANSAIEDLASGIELRVEQLGMPVRALTQADRDSIKAGQDLISVELATQIPTQSLLETIKRYIADTRALALETNNLKELQADLDFGFEALLKFQQLDSGPAGLGDMVDRLEAAGTIGTPLAASLRISLADIEGSLAKGNFGAAWADLTEFLQKVATQRGTGIPTNVAGSLIAYASYIQSLFPTTIVTAPMIQGVQRFGFHSQPTQFTVAFSEGLEASTVQRPANYRIIAPGPDGRFGTRDDRPIPIKSAIYDATTNTVTLTPARRLDLHRRYELIVNGSTPSGVADVAGNLLDGAGNGKPGSDYVVVLRGFGRDEPGRPFRKLIRDQLGGQPMSSRRVHLRPASRVSRQAHAGPAHAAAQHALREERAAVPHGPLESRRMRRSQ